MNSYTFHINFYDLAFLGAIFIGLSFAVLLWFAQTVNRSANRFLALALAVMVLWMIRVFAIDTTLEKYLPHWHWLPLQFLLALGPLMYFYVLKITRPQYKFSRNDLLHFSPFLLELVALAVEIKESAKTGAATYATHTFQQVNPVLQLLIFISNISYLYLCNKLIQHFYRRLQPVLMDRPQIGFRWLRRLLAATALLWLLWLVCAAISYFGYHNQLGLRGYYPFYIFFVVIIIWTAMATFLKPQAATVVQTAVPTIGLVPAELRAKGTLLKRAMETSLYYQDPDLSLTSLAEKLNMSSKELSRVINTAFNKNFNDFVNEYRVKEAARKMQDSANDNTTLLGIGFEAGFNSKTTFNRIFKEMTGKSPTEYKNHLKKERPNHDLGHQTRFGLLILNREPLPKWAPSTLNSNYMFRNYFKIAFRSFAKNKVFSFINVLGLSIGISAALVIFLIVYYEMSYDKFEKDSDHIYRVVMDVKFNGEQGYASAVPAPLGGAITNEVTGVELTVPTFTFQGDATAKVSVIRNNPANPTIFKKQPGAIFTNQQYLHMLGYQWVAGAEQKALQNPFAVVLSEKKAAQYFPGVAPADVVGKQITYNDDLKTIVTGVVKNLNENSSFIGDEFISVATISKTSLQQSFMMDVWNDWMAYSSVYVKLAKGATVAKTEAQLKSLLHKYNKDANKNAANTMVFKLQPLSDIHFNNQYGGVGMRIASKPTLYGLLAIAAFLLLLGCINFINLTTAQATQRAKEIGIRKTMGSTKGQLVSQFLSETFVITLAATLLSVILSPVLLHMFADFIPPGLEVNLLYKPNVIMFLVWLVLLVSFLAGLYPAMVLSGYKPVLVLKNQAYNGTAQTRSAWVRKTLTVSQFVIAQFFIIATIMVSKQIHFALTADMGMRKDAILNFSTPFSGRDSAATAKRQTLLNKIQSVPGVQLASAAFSAPAGEGASYGNIEYIEGKKDIKENVQVRWGDSNYLKVYQIKLVAGRNFLKGDSSRECLINEKYARDLGFQHADAALNKMVNWSGKPTRIVGVMHDFHEHSMHAAIEPIIFRPGSGEDFHIALEPQNTEGTTWQSAIDRIGKLYASTYPDDDFSYTFFDDTIAKFYKEDTNTAHLLNWSTGLTVLISCLGLFGLVLYTTNTRTKEIGIRKILGASVSSIVTILSKDFILLVVLAFAIAAPVAWWASYKWLEGFVYKTTISWWVFIASGLSMVLLALLTLSLQTIKAAMANPVGAIRSE